MRNVLVIKIPHTFGTAVSLQPSEIARTKDASFAHYLWDLISGVIKPRAPVVHGYQSGLGHAVVLPFAGDAAMRKDWKVLTSI